MLLGPSLKGYEVCTIFECSTLLCLLEGMLQLRVTCSIVTNQFHRPFTVSHSHGTKLPYCKERETHILRRQQKKLPL